MGNKEKDDGKLTKTMTPVEKELNADSVKVQLEEKVDYHNKLIAEKERLLGELNKVESALSQNIGGINTLQGLQKEYFVTDKPSDNGSA
jgi:ribosomal protein S2